MRIIIEAKKQDGRRFMTEPCEMHCAQLAATYSALAHAGFTHITTHRLDMVCDFCNEPGITRVFQITPGGFMGRMITDGQDATHIDRDGKWGACAQCAQYVTANDRDNLRRRAIAAYPDFMRSVAGPIVDGPHGCFWRGYTVGDEGEPVISDDELMNSTDQKGN